MADLTKEQIEKYLAGNPLCAGTDIPCDGHTCGECVRYEKREFRKDGYHCTIKDYDINIDGNAPACKHYWDRDICETIKDIHEQLQEEARLKRWAENESKPPVKLPIVFDGYGMIPECPNCGEMPYSTEQCYFCGIRFKQTDEVKEYATPILVDMKCPICGEVGNANKSRYNGHRHFKCEKCGCVMME